VTELAADLVRRRVAVIAALGSMVAALEAKAATTTVPIVFTGGADPVTIGLVESLHRPGGNVTGLTSMNAELMPKRLGLLHELLPRATRFAALADFPNNPTTESSVTALRAAGSAIGRQVEVFYASSNREIDTAFARLVQERVDALLILPLAFFGNRRVQLVTLAVHHRVPAIYFQRAFVETGGLMSYGTSLSDRDRQAGVYVGRILKGEKPGDLPVLQPAKFELVINLQASRLLGIEVPASLLALADEVIE
jgi:putative ABC transport system substrate-binding protein